MASTDYVNMADQSNYKDSVKTKVHAATIDDVTSEMRDKLPELMDLANAEFNLSLAAEQMSQADLAYGLCQMGAETFMHIHFIKEQLETFGIRMTEEEHHEYETLKNRYERFHR